MERPPMVHDKKKRPDIFLSWLNMARQMHSQIVGMATNEYGTAYMHGYLFALDVIIDAYEEYFDLEENKGSTN